MPEGITQKFHEKPKFSIVIATYGRGKEIEATLLSVQRQVLQSFEVLVVSDGPVHPGLKETVARFGPKFKVYELPKRTRSQSGPNNLGLEKARGEIIAYLGHDDVWGPNHLKSLLDVFKRNYDCSFAVSGTILIGPPGAKDEHTWVSGIFSPDDKDPGLNHFFPPSSIAHIKTSDLEIPAWPDPMSTSSPVDSHFILTAARIGHKFYSTQEVSVLKFSAALRYLSYLEPMDYEQKQALEIVGRPKAFEAFILTKVALAKKQGTYMFLEHPNPKDYEKGEILMRYEKIRGIEIDAPEVLSEPVRIEPIHESSGFDWHAVEQSGSHTWRWSGPSPTPRLPILYTSSRLASLTLHVARFATEEIKHSFQVFINGNLLKHTIKLVSGESYEVSVDVQLLETRASVLELRMCETVSPHSLGGTSKDTRKLGVCLTHISLSPHEPDHDNSMS